jgi:hypothetical protein
LQCKDFLLSIIFPQDGDEVSEMYPRLAVASLAGGCGTGEVMHDDPGMIQEEGVDPLSCRCNGELR